MTKIQLLMFLGLFLNSSQTPCGIDEYYNAIDDVNRQLEEIRKPGSSFYCPGLSLALSCGDGRCSSEEDETNCPADCSDALVTSYDNSMICKDVQQYFEPRSISEIQSLVNYASNADVSIRVVGSRHSVNNQYCNDGIVLGTSKLNHVLGIERNVDGTEGVWVESGILVSDLAEWLHKKNLSLGYAQLGFRLATVGGAIANGTHGSSIFHSAVMSSLVQELVLVDGNGKVRRITSSYGENPEIRAGRAHLGLLGVVARVKLKVVPQFNLEVKVTSGHDKLLLGKRGLFNEADVCDYTLINWFPNTRRFIKTCGVETKKRSEPGAENTLLSPPIPSLLIGPYRAALHLGMCSKTINAALEGARYLQLKWLPPLKKADDFGYVSSTSNAIGYSHRMLTSDLVKTKNKFFANDWEVAVPLSQAQNAMIEVSRYARQTGMSLPLVGIFLRFAPSEDLTLLAHTTSIGAFKKGEPVVFFEFATPVPVGFDDGMTQVINQTYEDLARLLVEKFDGRLHWGKNKEFAFEEHVSRNVYGKNFDEFVRVRESFDPKGLFLTPFYLSAGF